MSKDMPQFPGFAQVYDNLQATRDNRRTRPFYFDLDLSVPRSFANNTQFTIQIPGNSFYIDANPTDGNAVAHFQDINTDKTSVPFYISPGFIANIPFTQIAFENVQQSGKKIRVVYGIDLDFKPNTTSQIGISGTVSTIDGGKARTLNDQAFSAAGSSAQVAGQYSGLHLFNPVGSGKNVVIENVFTASSIATGFIHQFTSAVAGASPFTFSSKKNGVTQSTAMCYVYQNAAAPAGATIALTNGAVNTTSIYKPVEPIVIQPGYGYLVRTQNVNADVSATMEFYEEPQ